MDNLQLNSTSFALTVDEIFKSKSFYQDNAQLKYHQQIVNEYIKSNSVYGLLIFHDLGTGKSRIASAILVNSLINNRQVIFLSSKSLHENMQKNIDEYKKLANLEPTGDYKFVTMNASNMLEQLTDKNILDSHFEKKFKATASVNLDNKMLIVDEAHNLFNSITNGSKNAMGLYKAIMTAKNLKVVFLSGTPIVNHPFELVPCYNMIMRKQILPTDWDDFNNFFVDMDNKTIKNKGKFQNRIAGLTSYYGNLILNDKNPMDTGTIKKDDFPDKLTPEIIKVPMSNYQFIQYSIARDIEMHESSAGQSAGAALQKPQGIFSSSYRRLSRQFSNVAFPDHAMKINGKRIELISKNVDEDDLVDAKYSPKWEAILNNLKLRGKHLVYSSFVENAGIDMFSMYLENHGWVEHGKTGKKHYIKITGNVDADMRHTLINEFNHVDNKYGDKIKLIMISSAGAEGLDLKAVNTVHIMESYWNWVRLEQVIGRAVRYQSHIQLPEKERIVKTFIYCSVYPKNINPDNKLASSEKTTDEALLTKAQMLHSINYKFYIAMAEASIDCGAHNKNSHIKCRMCNPTNEMLYLEDVYKDMKIRSPCVPLKHDTVNAKEILVDGKKYAYYDDTILVWKDELNGYVEMERKNPLYGIIYDKIN